MLALILAVSCAFIGPPEFQEGGQGYCDTGAFEEVIVEVNPEWTEFKMTLHLSDKGFEKYSEGDEAFALFFANIIEDYAMINVSAEVWFYRKGEHLVHCYADFDEQSTICMREPSE